VSWIRCRGKDHGYREACAGIGRGAISFLSGVWFWSVIKRERFLVALMRDGSLLSRAIPTLLDHPQASVAPYVRRLEGGYAVNIGLSTKADADACRRARLTCGGVAGLVFIASYFLGDVILLVNVALFALCVFLPLGESGRNSAFIEVATLAVLLDKWRSEDQAECEHFVETTASLRPRSTPSRQRAEQVKPRAAACQPPPVLRIQGKRADPHD
jgi:hypothetical protein